MALPTTTRAQAAAVIAELTALLAHAGITLPSLAVDGPSVVTGIVLIDLGRARPDVVRAILDLLRDGLNHRDQQQR